ncbi:MAG TPA: flavodoxin domain-containing protein [Polyangiaceae bacterium]|nr:flavodoxin domain-containing protein [Polyangiaceae bacterium]
MNVLVAYAGLPASAEIAQQIADRLRKSGHTAAVRPIEQVARLEPYQAVVLGSTLRDEAWPPEACEFSSKFASSLAKVPLWLFTACTLAETEHDSDSGLTRRPLGERATLGNAGTVSQFREHRTFFWGPLARGRRGALFELLLQVCGGSAEDPREYRDVNDWTAKIARELHTIDNVRERRRLHLSVRGRPG